MTKGAGPTTDAERRRVGRFLATTGAVLGILAGAVQATAGSRIPGWTGAKADPVPLGLLTVALSLLALVAALALRTRPTAGRRAAVVAGLGVPALVCATTVGRLWLVPGALLLGAVVATVTTGGAGELVSVARSRWPGVLLSGLGACQVLVAVSAAPPATALLGALGGAAVVVVAWALPRYLRVAVVALGVVPFAVLTWTSLVTPLIAVLAVGLALGLPRARPDATKVPPTADLRRWGATTGAGTLRG